MTNEIELFFYHDKNCIQNGLSFLCNHIHIISINNNIFNKANIYADSRGKQSRFIHLYKQLNDGDIFQKKRKRIKNNHDHPNEA